MISSGPTVPIIMALIKAVVPLIENQQKSAPYNSAVKSCASFNSRSGSCKSSKAYITPKS